MKKILLLIFSLVLITGCGCTKKEEETIEFNKVNLNDKITEEKKLGNLVFNNTSIIYNEGISTFKATLTNNGEDIDINNIYVDCLSKNGTIIFTLKKEIKQTIKNNEKINIVIATDVDLTNIYDINYNID